jgi:hypothetical protein
MFLYKNKLLSPQQLKRLGEHKYNCENISLLDVTMPGLRIIIETMKIKSHNYSLFFNLGGVG